MHGPKGEVPGEQGEILVGGVLPIRPEEVVELRTRRIPGIVITTINDLIAQHSDPSNEYRHGSVSFPADEAIERLVLAGLTREEIARRDLLNVGDLYGDFGWNVEYGGSQRDDTIMLRFEPKQGE